MPVPVTVSWWPGGGGGEGTTTSDNFFRGAKIRNCQCEILCKYVKYGLSTSSKIVVILAFLCRYQYHP